MWPEGGKMKNKKYPHVVVRLMSAVYQFKKIEFVKEGPTVDWCEPVFRFKYAGTPIAADGSLKKEVQDLLIHDLQLIMCGTRFRYCLVLGPKSCIYFEKDGVQIRSDDIPSGGVEITKIEVTEKPMEN